MLSETKSRKAGKNEELIMNDEKIYHPEPKAKDIIQNDNEKIKNSKNDENETTNQIIIETIREIQ